MRKFKEGDKAIVLKNTSGHGFSIGAEVDVVGESGIYNGETEYECKTISEYWFLTTSELKKKENLEYKTSNRYKLHQAIKATGFHAEKLSLATGKAKNYFVGITAESRFIKHGDITKERLTYLLTMLAFAERDLRNIGNKTVESGKTYKPSQVKLTIDDVEIKYAVVESCGLSYNDYPLYDSTVHYPAEAKVNHNGEIKFAADVKIEEAKKDLDSFLLYPTDKPELSNFTKVGIIAIVILLLILIVKNLVV